MIFSKECNFEGYPISSEKNNICCLNPNIIQDNGYNVCTECGVVYSRIIEDSTRMAFTFEEKKERQINERVHSPIGPRTLIKGDKDAKGNCLSPKFKSEFGRLAKINRGFINGYEHNLAIALPIYNRLKFLFNIPNYIASDAYKIYHFTVKEKMARGRGIEALISASIFCALRMNDIPIILDDIIKNINVTKREFLNSFRLIHRKVLPYLNFKFKSIRPIKYLDTFVKELNLSMKCRHIAVDLIENGKQDGLIISGKDPKGIAAASLYLSAKICNEPRIQKEICKFANITEVTMRARMYELMQFNPLLK
ncbi:MAG: transcription initiation factor IIB family protein [Promethearchaeota archaeon]